MVLVLNIGNTHITLGGFEQDELFFSARMATRTHSTDDEYACAILNLLALRGVNPQTISGMILASVVPDLTDTVSKALRQLSPVRLLTVGPGLKSGLKLCIDNPAQLGAELLCGIVASFAHCKPPFVFLHADTALSMMAVNAQGELCGGVFLPAPKVAMQALVQRTAQLPQVALNGKPAQLLSTNSADCLRAGIVLGSAAQIDGLLAQFAQELGEQTVAIATGAFSNSIRLACHTPIMYSKTLVLEGLYAIWKRNARPQK